MALCPMGRQVNFRKKECDSPLVHKRESLLYDLQVEQQRCYNRIQQEQLWGKVSPK